MTGKIAAVLEPLGEQLNIWNVSGSREGFFWNSMGLKFTSTLGSVFAFVTCMDVLQYSTQLVLYYTS
jgi:hypothetical protein